jgi:hypothetical protein
MTVHRAKFLFMFILLDTNGFRKPNLPFLGLYFNEFPLSSGNNKGRKSAERSKRWKLQGEKVPLFYG